MRIIFIPPSQNDFSQLFSITPLLKGGGLDDITVFQPARRLRKGSGFFSLISGIAKRVLPFLFKAAKPAAKEFGKSVIEDVITKKRPIRQSLKENGVNALKQTGMNMLRGSGKVTKKRKLRKRKKMKKTLKTIILNKKKKKGNLIGRKCSYISNVFDDV